MTAAQWARVLAAGRDGLNEPSVRGLTGDPAWEGLWAVLDGMARECAQIAAETR